MNATLLLEQCLGFISALLSSTPDEAHDLLANQGEELEMELQKALGKWSG